MKPSFRRPSNPEDVVILANWFYWTYMIRKTANAGFDVGAARDLKLACEKQMTRRGIPIPESHLHV